MSTAMRTHRVRVLPRSLALIALVVSLAASATVTGILRASPASSGLIWVCLLPLMWAIRSLRPASAAIAGAGWGLGVCLLPSAVTDSWSTASPTLLLVLPLLTGAYAALGALASRAVRFVTPILAFGWILVEIPLARLNVPGGLLLGMEIGDPILGSVARFFGYALAALLVVGVNASLLSLLCGIRELPMAPLGPNLSPCVATFARHVCDDTLDQRWVLRQVYPRGPPAKGCPPVVR